MESPSGLPAYARGVGLQLSHLLGKFFNAASTFFSQAETFVE